MEVDKELSATIQKAVGPIVGSAVAALAVGLVGAVAAKLLVSNYQQSDIIGDGSMKPTDDDVTISKVETSAKDTDASLGKDEVTAKDGDLSAVRTDAAASSGEATALDSGATAARTKAGAADIETKSLKMT